MAEKKIPLMVTPKGPAAYAWLSKPDTKFMKRGKPVYKVTVIFPKEAIPPGRINFGNDVLPGPEWMKHLVGLCKEHGVDAKPGKGKCPIKDGDTQKDKEGNQKPEFANSWFITFKTTFKPDLVDTKGNPLPESVPVYSGDIVKVAFAAKPVTSTEKVRNADGEVETVEARYLALYLNKVMLVEKLAGGSNVEMGDEEGFEITGNEADGTDVDFGGDDSQEDGDF